METTFGEVVNILMRVAGIYLFIILGLRLFGKSEVSQLTIFDLVFILLISNAVQNAMVGPSTSLTGGIVAATGLFIMNRIFKTLNYRLPGLSKLIQGEPVILIHSGRVVEANLKRVQITMAELEATVREHGVDGIDEVNLAILETDGNISILSNNFTRRTHKHRSPPKMRGGK